MDKMLFQLELPTAVAKAKEDLGVNNLWKYLRYIRMFMERSKLVYKGQDISYPVYNTLLWQGAVALVKDKILGLVIASIDSGKKDYNGYYTEVNVSAENGYKRTGVKVGEECIIMYHDSTRIAPIIYIWAIANEVIAREDIIRQQDNMLRKPILVDGVGEDFDNSMVKASNVLSGVSFITKKSKKSKANVMDSDGIEVLNLQVGNAYKGAELWTSRKNLEELICDYLGYSTAKNEKKERVNVPETMNENSIGMTFYEAYLYYQHKAVDECREKLGEELEFIELLKKPEEMEDKEDVSDENEVD